MAQERVDIRVTETGSRRVKRSMDEIGRSSKKAGGFVSGLKRALLAVGLSAVASSILQTADAYTNMQNQLRLVTSSTEGLSVATEGLLEVANRTRSSIEASAALYVKTSRSAKELGITQNEVLQFTEQLNQAVILSGSSGQEASAGIRQLGQAIGSGVLRGDELNSVLENTSEVAQVIAKGMGVTIGQLRALGSEGKITAKNIIESFSKARVELGERFAKTVPTLAQSIEVASNKWKIFIGQLDTSTGITGALAQGILFLAQNLGDFARVAGVAAFTIGVVLARQAIPAAIAGVKAFTAALLANPVGALLVGLTALVAGLVAFSDQITVTSDGFITLADVGAGAWTLIQTGLTSLMDYARTAWAAFTGIVSFAFGESEELSTSMFDGFKQQGESWLRFTARIVDGALGMFVGFGRGAMAVIENVTALFSDWASRLGEFITSGFDAEVFTRSGALVGRGFGDAFIGGMADGINGFTFFQDALTGLGEASEAAALQRHAAEARSKAARDQAQLAFDRSPGTATAAAAAKSKGPSFAELMGEMQTEARLLSENLQTRQQLADVIGFEAQLKRQLTDGERAGVEAMSRANEALAVRANIMDSIQGPTMQYNQQMQALREILQEQPQLVNEVTNAMANLQATFIQNQQGQGFGAAFMGQTQLMLLATRNATTEMGKLFGGVFQSVTDGFAEATARSIVFGESFAQSIKSAAQSILSELLSSLIKVTVQLLINKAIASSSPVGIFAGLPAGLAGVAGRQSGGYAGDGPTSKPAGIYHGQEFVLNAAATKRVGRGKLNAVNNGGSLGGTAPQMNVSVINNEVPGMTFETNQLTPYDVEVIAKQAVHREAGTVMAKEVRNASSSFSRALGTSVEARRKR